MVFAESELLRGNLVTLDKAIHSLISEVGDAAGITFLAFDQQDVCDLRRWSNRMAACHLVEVIRGVQQPECNLRDTPPTNSFRLSEL